MSMTGMDLSNLNSLHFMSTGEQLLGAMLAETKKYVKENTASLRRIRLGTSETVTDLDYDPNRQSMRLKMADGSTISRKIREVKYDSTRVNIITTKGILTVPVNPIDLRGFGRLSGSSKVLYRAASRFCNISYTGYLHCSGTPNKDSWVQIWTGKNSVFIQDVKVSINPEIENRAILKSKDVEILINYKEGYTRRFSMIPTSEGVHLINAT